MPSSCQIAVGDLKQSVRGVELRLTPQAWVDGGRRVVLQEFVAIGIGRVWRRRDETAVGIFKVLTVVERQLRKNGAVRGYNRLFRRHRLLGTGLRLTKQVRWRHAQRRSHY